MRVEKKVNDIILFVAKNAQHASATKPVYEEMKKRGYEVLFIRSDATEMINFTYFLRNIRLMVVSDLDFFRYSMLYPIIFIPHGVSDHESGNLHHFFTLNLLPGSHLGDIWKNVFHFNNKEIQIVGWPKSDMLFKKDNTEIMKQITNKCKLFLPYKKTILYAPTGDYPHISSFDKSAIPILNMVKKLDVNLIIKPHVDSKTFKNYDKVKRKAQEMETVFWISPQFKDIMPLYLFGDVLISDGSSTIREFMLTNKPIIQLTNISKSKLSPGVIKSSVKNLPKKVMWAMDHPEESEKEREYWSRKFFYKLDGHATERAVNAIIKALNSEYSKTQQIARFFKIARAYPTPSELLSNTLDFIKRACIKI